MQTEDSCGRPSGTLTGLSLQCLVGLAVMVSVVVLVAPSCLALAPELGEQA